MLDNYTSGTKDKWTARHGFVQCVRRSDVPAAQASGWETRTTAQWMLDKGVNKVRGAGLTHDRDYTLQDLELLVCTIGHALELDYDVVRQRIRPQLEEAGARTGRAGSSGSQAQAAPCGLEWECDYCPRNFASYNQLAEHATACLTAFYGTDCFRCRRHGHWQNDCKYKTDVDGAVIEEWWSCDFCGRDFDTLQQAERHEDHCTAAHGDSSKRGRTASGRRSGGGRSSSDDNDGDGCFRCGRDSHWARDCFARTHAGGWPLDD